MYKKTQRGRFRPFIHNQSYPSVLSTHTNKNLKPHENLTSFSPSLPPRHSNLFSSLWTNNGRPIINAQLPQPSTPTVPLFFYFNTHKKELNKPTPISLILSALSMPFLSSQVLHLSSSRWPSKCPQTWKSRSTQKQQNPQHSYLNRPLFEDTFIIC